jgi:hypothetical protein
MREIILGANAALTDTALTAALLTAALLTDTALTAALLTAAALTVTLRPNDELL